MKVTRKQRLLILPLALGLAAAAFAQPVATKSFNPSTIALGGTSTITFNVANPSGTVTLTGVSFTDNLPTGLVIAAQNNLTGFCTGSGSSASVNGPPGATVTAFSNGILMPNASCTYTVNVVGQTPGPKDNTTGPVNSSAGLGTPGTATLTVTAIGPTLTKSFGSTPQLNFGSAPLTFTVTNPNNGTLTGISFTDTLPGSLSVSSPNGLSGSCDGGTITAVPGSQTISLTGATLAANASCTFSVQVLAAGFGPVTNTTSNITADGGLVGTPATATTGIDYTYFLWFFS